MPTYAVCRHDGTGEHWAEPEPVHIGLDVDVLYVNLSKTQADDIVAKLSRTPRVYTDFESRSQVDIWKVGGWVYAQHPSTEILCLCYAVDDGPVVRLTRGKSLQDGIAAINKMVREGYEFHAHNAYFERCMWFHQLIRFYGARPMPIKSWRCTAAKCSAHALPRSLEHAAKALGLEQQKDMEGHKLMMKLARSTGPISQDDLDRLTLYCARDILTEREMDKRLPDLPEQEQRIWCLDQYINDTGVAADMDAVAKANELILKEKEALNNELSLLTGGDITAGTQTAAIKGWLEKKGLVLPNLQKGTVKDALKSADPKFTRILALRQQLSLTSLAKYESLMAATSADGRVRDLLVYHGASTGRWSGKLVQIQNLAKPEEADFDNRGPISLLKKDPAGFSFLYEGDVLPKLSSCIRGMFIPSPGHEMFVTDFAAIEARVVMWLAGEEGGLEKFRDQDRDPSIPDIYVHMARAIRKNPTLTKKDKKDRQLGKQTVLGCGFGMGEVKFQETCDKYGVDLGERTLRVERNGETYTISPLARESVQAYRSTFPKVPAFWYAMEEAAKQTVLSGNCHKVGKIIWKMDGEFLRMILPSDRTLAYHHPKVDASGKLSIMAADPVTKHYRPEVVWGGVLVENCLTRDTKVLTICGVKDIVYIQPGEKVWDGKDWVETKGCIPRGTRAVGQLAGIRITPDHKILVGNLWKSAIALDEKDWHDALEPGLFSVASACYKAGPGVTAKLFADVLAAIKSLSTPDNSSARPRDAENARPKRRGKRVKNTRVSCLESCWQFGSIAIQVLSPGAITRGVKRILTTVAGALMSIPYGVRIGKRFWNTLRLSPSGIIQLSISTAVTILGGMNPGTSTSVHERITHATDGKLLTWFIVENGCRTWSFGSGFALIGKAIMLYIGTYLREKHPKRLWSVTRKPEAVYDLLACGPRNRFTVISADGPVIVHNCTQAVARDIMAESMLTLARSGFRILFTVHDELVVEAPRGEKTVDDVLRIVRTVPPWAAGCPINAEAEKKERYAK